MSNQVNMEMHNLIEESVFGVGGKAAIGDFGKLRQLPIPERVKFVEENFKLIPDSDVIRPSWECLRDRNYTPTERVIVFFDLLSDQSPILCLADRANDAPKLMLGYCFEDDIPDTDYRVMSMSRASIGYLHCFAYLCELDNFEKARNFWIGVPTMLQSPVSRSDYFNKIRREFAGYTSK